MMRKGTLLKYFRLSRKQYLIDKMLRYKLIPKGMDRTMKKHFSTEEVENFFAGMAKTRYGKRQLHKVI